MKDTTLPRDDYYHLLASELQAEDIPRAAAYLAAIEGCGLPADLFDDFVDKLKRLLPGNGEIDRVLRDLSRFLVASRSPHSWLALFEREPSSFETLVNLFAASESMSAELIADPEAFELLRMTAGQPVELPILLDEVMAAVAVAKDTRSVMSVLRDYRHRELLRIAFGDFVAGQSVAVVSEQLSNLAECLVRGAVWSAQRDLQARRACPIHADGTPLAFSVIALGKLGGGELNYSDDIDLMFVYENLREASAGQRRSGSSSTAVEEYFQRLGQLIIRLLSESTGRGIAYRVDMRHRPHGDQGPLAISFSDAFNHYDMSGRTWERQVFIKARAIAGDLVLGSTLIEQLQPWVYRRYLMRADISGIIALKRRLEQRASQSIDDESRIRERPGGIRAIEQVIQFLQLLHGGETPTVRCTGTLEAIERFYEADCLSHPEQLILKENYEFLRRLEHHLQAMFDRQTQTLPGDKHHLQRLASRLGYVDVDGRTAAETLLAELDNRTSANQAVLNRLLESAFEAEEDQATPESDLIQDPWPEAHIVQEVLRPYGFVDPQGAYRHLQQLAVETIPFLSTRRCRHFLASIATKLLTAISHTPSPDATLISLANISDSLGGKSVLWELFNENPPSMQLCVQLCACSPYLAGILTSSPGMLDELLDSLMLDTLPDRESMAGNLDELCRGQQDISPMLHSFKNSMHLRVGVRDILGKDDIVETHAALSDIAEVCLEQVIHHEFHRLIHQLGMPLRQPAREHQAGNEVSPGEPAELVVLAAGKLGGREPNYHSDLDMIFLFDGEGLTKSLVPNRRFEPTTNRHFFNQLCQRVIQTVTRVGTTGKLFDLDVRLRPLGRSGVLAVTLDELHSYFTGQGGQVWELQALCKARPIWGSPRAQAAAMQSIRSVLGSLLWTPQLARQFGDYRLQLQEGASPRNLKRGPGGTMDIEFLVQVLQLKYASEQPEVLTPGTLQALARLQQYNCLSAELAQELSQHYRLLRRFESGIRLMNMSARHELPTDEALLQRLAFLLRGKPTMERPGAEEGASLAVQCEQVQRRCREIFNQQMNLLTG
jgi:[glutamine synthetase] adenylyltransferase / [glutamine synthetase]-adenylyl-L-tyrosine phosphorylase